MYEIKTEHKLINLNGQEELITLKWSFEAILVNANARWINGYNTLANGKLKVTTFKLDDDFYIEVYDPKGNKILYGGNHNDLRRHYIQA